MKIRHLPGYRRCNNTVMWQIQKKLADGGSAEKNHLKKGKHLFFHFAVPVNPAMPHAPGKHKFDIWIVLFPDGKHIANWRNLIFFIMYP